MKKILTNNIVENTRRQPFNKASLEHIQEAFQEVMTAMFKNLTEDTSSFFRLYGLIDQDGGADYNISAGAVYYNGEVYLVDAFVATDDPGKVPVLNFVTSYRAGDPVTFTDNNTFNVHEIKKMVITLDTSGAGAVNFSALAVLGQSWVTTTRIAANAVTKAKVGNQVYVANFVNATSADLDDIGDTANIQMISADNANAPTASAGDRYILFTTVSQTVVSFSRRVQVAIGLVGTKAGWVYFREHTLGSWGAWTAINDPAA